MTCEGSEELGIERLKWSSSHENGEGIVRTKFCNV
jgi:hypothetical protein